MPDQFYTDFGQYSVDQQPSDWTRRWSTVGAWLVREKMNPYGPNVLEWDGSTNEDQLIAWDAIDATGSDAEEMAMAFRTAGDTNGQGRLQVRASGSFADRTCYLLNVQATNNQIQIARIVDGGFTSINTAAFTINLNTWYLFRFRAENENGDVRLLGKAWEPTDLNDPDADEPASWMIDELDTSATRITTPGWMGVGHFNQSGIKDYAFVSGGINGASAPLTLAEITWIAPPADSTLTGVVDLVTETDDDRVTTVEYLIDGVPIGSTGPDS